MRNRAKSFVAGACLFALVGAGVLVQSGYAQPGAGGGQPRQPDGQGRRGGQPGQPGGPGGPGGQQGGRAASVEGSMRGLNRALREVKASVGDATKQEQTLMGVYGMQAACATAKRAKPEHLKGDEAKMLGEFRRDMHAMTALLVELEGQVLDGKVDAAGATVKKIEAARDAAHEKFGVKDEDEEGDKPAPSGN